MTRVFIPGFLLHWVGCDEGDETRSLVIHCYYAGQFCTWRMSRTLSSMFLLLLHLSNLLISGERADNTPKGKKNTENHL